MAKQDFSAAALAERIAYNPETGVLTWRAHRWPELVGQPITFWMDRGYPKFRLGRKWQRSHRVAWALMTGEWPSDIVDHINGVRDDNRWRNLRLSSDSMNQQNRLHPERGNKSGWLGVTKKRYSYQASITLKNKKIELGFYRTPEEAHAAYMAAKRELHPHAWVCQNQTSAPAISQTAPDREEWRGGSIIVGGTRPQPPTPRYTYTQAPKTTLADPA